MTADSFDDLLGVTKLQPGYSEAALRLGLKAITARREAEALPVLAAAEAANPHDAALPHVTGLMYRAIGDLAAAIAAFDRGLAVSKASARLYHARATAAMEAGLPALYWFEAARRLAPADGDVILGHAAALLNEGQRDAADVLLCAMLRQHPGWLPGHSALLQLRYAAGDRTAWLDEISAAIDMAPRDPRLRDIQIMALGRAGDSDAARAALAAATATAGTSAMQVTAAIIGTEHGDLDAADHAFASLDPTATPGLAIHWLRHLLRRHRADEVELFDARLAAAMRPLARPYLALAWRLLGDQRAASVDGVADIRIVDFGTDWPLLPPLAEALRALHVQPAQPLDQSVRGGTQTDGPLLSRVDPAIRALRERVEAEVAAYIAAMPATPARPFAAERPARPRFTGSWSVRLAGGGFHEPHVHGDGWLSSAFYIAVPPGLDGDAGALTIGAPQASLGLDLEPQRCIAAHPGRLILFPSTSWHGTRPFPAGERLTLAFDIG